MPDIDFERDIRIDETALDVEWLEQATLALKYVKYLVKLKAKLRRLEEKKKITRSELILEVNADPEGLIGKKKPNANDIEAYYRAHDDYKEVIEELLEVQEKVEFAELAKNEICWTRKAALENLVQLHGQMYFAGPKVPRNLTDERKRKEMDRKASTGVAKRLNRRRKRK